MDKKMRENHLKAGKILHEVRQKAIKSIKPGQKLLEIAESIEKDIIDATAATADGGIGFPVNLSMNNVAAHFTPGIADESVLEENCILKLDIGVQVNGRLADSAVTLDFSGEYGKLLEASYTALQNAISVLKIGLPISKIGAEIENTIKKYGFKPVRNLSGHGLGEYIGHAPPTIPNIDNRDSKKIEEGMAFAIEPFTSTGEGFVREGNLTEIFALDHPKPVRNIYARQILKNVEEKFKTLAFAERHVAKDLSEFNRKVAMRELLSNKCLHAYPILKESEGVMIAQFETDFLVDGEEIIQAVPLPKF